MGQQQSQQKTPNQPTNPFFIRLNQQKKIYIKKKSNLIPGLRIQTTHSSWLLLYRRMNFVLF